MRLNKYFLVNCAKLQNTLYKHLAKTLFIGKELYYMPTCHSTNDEARQKGAYTDIGEGAVFITSLQTKGRGQRGNQWESESHKNLLVSVVLKPVFLRADEHFYLNMVSALAVRRCVEQVAPHANIKVKWPNDVLVNEQKIAGILIENTLKGSRILTAIVGMGLNVNQSRFSNINATSLKLITGEPFELTDVFERFILALEHYYLLLKAQKYEQLKSEYMSHLLGYHAKRNFRTEHVFTGEVIDVKKNGLLVLRTNQGERTFDFKELTWL